MIPNETKQNMSQNAAAATVHGRYDLKNDPYLKYSGIASKQCINFDPKHYKYLNSNPAGVISGSDDVFQILTVTFPDKTPQEIADMIFDMQAYYGKVILDRELSEKILNAYLDISKVSLSKGMKVSDFLECWDQYVDRNTFVIVKARGSYELFQDGAFYSHHVINSGLPLYSIYHWKCRDEHDIRKDKISTRKCVPIEDNDIFRYYNNNPLGIETDDCICRALALFFDISWRDALRLNADYFMKHGVYFYDYDVDKYMTVIAMYMLQNGYHNIIDDHKEYPGCVYADELITKHPEYKKGKYLFLSNNHAAVMINGIMYDIRNSSHYGYYFCFKAK